MALWTDLGQAFEVRGRWVEIRVCYADPRGNPQFLLMFFPSLPYEYARAENTNPKSKQGRFHKQAAFIYLPRILISSIVQHKIKLCP